MRCRIVDTDERIDTLADGARGRDAAVTQGGMPQEMPIQTSTMLRQLARKRHAEFPVFLGQLDASLSKRREIRLTLDNVTHMHPESNGGSLRTVAIIGTLCPRVRRG
jgi:hypothetical protein